MACQEDEGNIAVYQNMGVHGMIGLGTKHIKVCSSFHPKIRSLKSTKVGSKLLVCIEGEGGGDTFDPSSKNTVICEYHFKEEHLKKAAGSTRKTYTEDAVPSIFKFKYLTRLNEKAISKRPAPKERLALNYIASDSSDESESCAAINSL